MSVLNFNLVVTDSAMVLSIQLRAELGRLILVEGFAMRFVNLPKGS